MSYLQEGNAVAAVNSCNDLGGRKWQNVLNMKRFQKLNVKKHPHNKLVYHKIITAEHHLEDS